ncbi:MAG: membrane associated rhomboid family serine protease [Flavobacteriales bacterium]|jgi:membrane associated rhomboid family serine protease
MNDIKENIKRQYNAGGMYLKLLFINIAIFLVIGITGQILILMNSTDVYLNILEYTSLNTAWEKALLRPWTWITSIFLHYSFRHIFSNMVTLYLFGQIIHQFLGSKKTLSIYVVGGLIGCLLQVVAKHSFPLFEGMPDYSIVGASGGVIALGVAAATYKPNYILNLFGILKLKLWILVGILVALDFVSIADSYGVAHFAHIGGALFGFFTIRLLQQGKDITKWFDRWMVKLQNLLKRKPRSKMSVEYSKSRGEKPPRNDYDYNESKVEKQAKVDAILDKIKYKGYDGLSKAEKDYLSRQ